MGRGEPTVGGMMRLITGALVGLALAVLLGVAPLAVAEEGAVLVPEAIGLSPAKLRALLPGQEATIVTTSWAASITATNSAICRYTPASGTTAYVLGARAGGDAVDRKDVWINAAYAETVGWHAANGMIGANGYVLFPNWQSLSLAGDGTTTMSVRNAIDGTGTMAASMVILLAQ